MARPPVIEDTTILRAAKEVFLTDGVRATTAKVAEHAGVSEGTIFKRFKSKENLFAAAMSFELADRDFTKSLPERVGQGIFRDQLYEVALEGIAFFRTLVPLVMMTWANPESRYHPHEQGVHPAIAGFRRLEMYFEGERRLGRLRSIDTEVLARLFVGALWHYASMEVLQGPHETRPLGPEAYCRVLVDVMLVGIEPART
jgi:AcrR family transcriptional regulator